MHEMQRTQETTRKESNEAKADTRLLKEQKRSGEEQGIDFGSETERLRVGRL
jgi:hypothetical protein